MEKLNRQQHEAVHYCDGPLLVLAGAGSGKTRVIAHKIAHLIDKHGIDPKQIIAITFTNKAAREMQERVNALVHKRKSGPWIGTFHRFGLKILRSEAKSCGYRPNFSVLDATDCAGLLADLMRREKPNSDIAVTQVQQCISSWKYAFVDPDRLAPKDLTPPQTLAAKCFRRYCDALSTFNAVDFDDLIMRPVELFRADDQALQRFRTQLSHLLVDEHQDTNEAQYGLIKLLVGLDKNLTVVGDDDQSIYTWRGADPENIRRLTLDFPNLKVIKMEQNYRSTGTILNAANALIAHNPRLYEKRLWAEHGFGDKIRVIACRTEHDEVDRVVTDILHRRLLHRYQYGDFAVLLRSNHQARLFERAFRERNIPYILSGGRSFFDYSEIKDCICYLRLLGNTADDNALLRVINTPRRAIGAQTVKLLVESASEIGQDLTNAALSDSFAGRASPLVLKRMRGFANWLLEFQRRYGEASPTEALMRLLDDIAYKDWLESSSDNEQDAARRIENVDELQTWIQRIEESDQSRTIVDVVSALTLFDIAERKNSEDKSDAVSLTTLHAAKGLEYPHVFLAGFEEDLIPHRTSINEGNVDEERRLAYVGITRARRTLTISFSRSRKRYGQITPCDPSRFLDELPAEDLAWDSAQTDDNANHEVGKGTLEQLKRVLQT